MNKVWGAIASAYVVFFSACTASGQVSNSLEALPDTTEEALGSAATLIKPDEVRTLLVEAGLPILSEEPMPEGNGTMIVVSLQGLPLFFGFSECRVEGCALMMMVHPSPLAAAGLTSSPQLANELNALFPLGTMIDNGDGNMIYRYGLPATPGCEVGCVTAHMELFLISLNEYYAMIMSEIGGNTAGLAPAEEDRAAIRQMVSLSVTGGSDLDLPQLGHPHLDVLRDIPLERLYEIVDMGAVIDGAGKGAWAPLLMNGRNRHEVETE